MRLCWWVCQRSSWPTSQCCPAWANWLQLINALVDDANKNTCMGGWVTCCFVRLGSLLPAAECICRAVPGRQASLEQKEIRKDFPIHMKGHVTSYHWELKKMSLMSFTFMNITVWRRKHSNSCQDFGHIPLSSILLKK